MSLFQIVHVIYRSHIGWAAVGSMQQAVNFRGCMSLIGQILKSMSEESCLSIKVTRKGSDNFNLETIHPSPKSRVQSQVSSDDISIQGRERIDQIVDDHDSSNGRNTPTVSILGE